LNCCPPVELVLLSQPRASTSISLSQQICEQNAPGMELIG